MPWFGFTYAIFYVEFAEFTYAICHGLDDMILDRYFVVMMVLVVVAGGGGEVGIIEMKMFF